MPNTLNQIITEYKTEIKPYVESDLSDLNNLITGINISQEYLHRLRDIIKEKVFTTPEAEILFFKVQKPLIYGHFKYFVKLHRYVLEKPQGSIKKQRIYIDALIEKLQCNNLKYIDFVRYYRQCDSRLDKYYFVRGKENLNLISDTSHYYTDPDFSTSHDNMVAQIIAFDMLIYHYNQELKRLHKLQNSIDSGDKNCIPINELSWTASKTDLVEIIYALQASGAIRNGEAEIKKMSIIFEKLFNLELGNVYRTYLEIKERKKDRTSFLTHLKMGLERKMDEDDEKY
uniref:RteC domain-containing protein n=1 Tax=Gelidibacter sp. TaxID=2018083 RepID=UPI004049AEF5